MYGSLMGRLQLYAVQEGDDVSSRLFSWTGNLGDKWYTTSKQITKQFTKRYYLQFEATHSKGYRNDIAIDDVVMSPFCFGVNVTTENYRFLKSITTIAAGTSTRPVNSLNQGLADTTAKSSTLKISSTIPTTTEATLFTENNTRFVFTTCGKTGNYGPSQEDCDTSYMHTNVQVTTNNGYQRWIVPLTGFYKFVVKGAGGGNGAENPGPSKGAQVTAVLNLTVGDELEFLVGQKGRSACMVRSEFPGVQEACSGSISEDDKSRFGHLIAGGGGGGGGGTFVALVLSNTNNNEKRRKSRNVQTTKIPLIVAGGGGGLSFSPSREKRTYLGSFGNEGNGSNGLHGTDLNNSPGAGGGWNGTSTLTIPHISNGMSFLQGGVGGKGCKRALDEMQWKLPGGFGGGGGGCTAGGGGGGFTGGNAPFIDALVGNGLGGTSFVVDSSFESEGLSGSNQGPGEILVDIMNACSDGSFIEFNSECPLIISQRLTMIVVVSLIALIIVLLCLLIPICISHKRLSKSNNEDADRLRSELALLRQNVLSESNPLYLSKGSSVTDDDLLELQREKLKLLHLLGSGAFGEVYKGTYDCPQAKKTYEVAIKTLSKVSTEDCQNDFLIEALLLSSLSHRNVMRFIGVSFIKLPRLLVVEFLSGGELKTFLRNNRPSSSKPSILQMSDLLRIGIDVAAGCDFLESVRFVHRDIAARNILLSCKSSNRVAKIGDFGMARDIYKVDYYRKDKQTLLPVKWMPQESYLDGVFTHKSDVWSYGVLLWEIFSFGYVPYPGLTNQEVMQCVSRGQRMKMPTYSHKLITDLTMACWRHEATFRPSFSFILKEITHLGQMKEILSIPIPSKSIDLDRGLVWDESIATPPQIPNNSADFIDEIKCGENDFPTDSEGYLQSDSSPIQRHTSKKSSKKRPFLPVFMHQKSISNVYSDTSESPSPYPRDQIDFGRKNSQETEPMLSRQYSSEPNGLSPTSPTLSPDRRALLAFSGTSYEGDIESDMRESEV